MSNIDGDTGSAMPAWREPAIADSARSQAQCIRFLASVLPQPLIGGVAL